MQSKVNSILNEVLEKVKPSQKEINTIENLVKAFLIKFKKRVKALKIDAEVFVGGSFAKKTVIKKEKYDVDVFVRFDKKYPDEEISKLTEKIIERENNVSKIHGSRDYFSIKINDWFFIELIPVKKVKNPKEAENITDLSYSHVRYINKKIKSKKMLEEIMLAKAFCYANHCYGAESYINGFSGYALELLVYYYGSFLKFIKAVQKIGTKKEIIDIEKHYKNKKNVLMDLNSSKLISPIILIDPTYKQRNALAALSDETFKKFKKDSQSFLKNPETKAFELEKTNLEEIKKHAELKKSEFILIEAKTDKQEGDVAGSKLFKFYNHLEYELKRFFEIKNKGFNYNGKQAARYFFVVNSKKEILIEGPYIKDDKKNVVKFRKKHKKTFVKKDKVYAREKIKVNAKEFIKSWKQKNKKKVREMSVIELKTVE